MISQLNLKREINFSEYPLSYFKGGGVKAKRRGQKFFQEKLSCLYREYTMLSISPIKHEPFNNNNKNPTNDQLHDLSVQGDIVIQTFTAFQDLSIFIFLF